MEGHDGFEIKTSGTVYRNLSVPALYEQSVLRREGRIALGGPLAVMTGKHTGRSPGDRFFVREPASEGKIWWSEGNKAVSEEVFNRLLDKMLKYAAGRDIFTRDCFVGADESSRLAVRVINEYAWQNLFAKNLFIEAPAEGFAPDFTVLAFPGCKADPATDGTRSETFIIINFARRMVLIGGTAYAGEIKKSLFTAMNYLLPLKGIMTMHCSANIGADGGAALFFGLSGTGKTSLSADPSRRLVGDDEHGWNDVGIFNFEGGCYAKVINLSEQAEPQIYGCTRRFGTVIENVPVNAAGALDLDDGSVTPNTRAGYPLDFIANAEPSKKGPHPKDLVMLTCDAFGVMPPLARLSPEQALYHFISGYTAKVGGTEVGLSEPQAVFSACFGAPFMAHHPALYAQLLKKNIIKHNVRCWLVNTGWVGGPYGEGSRVAIKHTRAMLGAALDGRLDGVPFAKDPVFGFGVPQSCPGVPENMLDQRLLWKDKAAHAEKYRRLAALFGENFGKFKDGCAKEVTAAGPS
ncbi:MAG: phosphoenolpyruvate carboxykinase (ATP) [Elusimicrobiales bacterium]